jgi:hypothetical protein
MDVVSNFLKDNIHHKSMQKKNYPDVCCICCWSENEKFSGGSHLDSKITQDQDSAVLHACMLNEAGRLGTVWNLNINSKKSKVSQQKKKLIYCWLREYKIK